MTVERGLAMAVSFLMFVLMFFLGCYHRNHYEITLATIQEENCSAEQQNVLDTHRAYFSYFVAAFCCGAITIILSATTKF